MPNNPEELPPIDPLSQLYNSLNTPDSDSTVSPAELHDLLILLRTDPALMFFVKTIFDTITNNPNAPRTTPKMIPAQLTLEVASQAETKPFFQRITEKLQGDQNLLKKYPQPLQDLCLKLGISKRFFVREISKLSPESLTFFEDLLDETYINGLHQLFPTPDDHEELLEMLTYPGSTIFFDLKAIFNGQGQVTLAELITIKDSRGSKPLRLDIKQLLDKLYFFFGLIKRRKLKTWLKNVSIVIKKPTPELTAPLELQPEPVPELTIASDEAVTEGVDLWQKWHYLTTTYPLSRWQIFLSNPKSFSILERVPASALADYNSKTVNFLDFLLKFPEFSAWIREAEDAKDQPLPWKTRLALLLQAAETLGLAGTTVTEINAALVMRRAQQLKTSQPEYLTQFRALNLSGKAKETGRLRGGLTLAVLKEYVAFVQANRDQVATWIEYLDLPQLPPESLPAKPSLFDIEAFEQLENREWLDHLTPTIGWEREFKQPKSWEGFLNESVMRVLHKVGWRQGRGGGTSIEWSPGPFKSWELSYASFALLENLNLTNFHGALGNSLHFNRGVTFKRLTTITEFLIEGCGYARLSDKANLTSREGVVLGINKNPQETWVESKRPNHTHHQGTREMMRAQFLLGSAQKAYEKALIEIYAISGADISNGRSHSVSVLNQETGDLNLLSTHELEQTHLTPEELELAFVYRRLLKDAYYLFNHLNLLSLFESEENFTTAQSLHLRRLIGEVFPTVYDFLDEENLTKTSKLGPHIIYGQTQYPNPIAAYRACVQRYCQEIEEIHEEAYMAFISTLRRLYHHPELLHYVDELTAFFERFPCNLDQSASYETMKYTVLELFSTYEVQLET